MQVLHHLIALLESLKRIKVSLSALNALNRFLNLEHRTATLGSLSLSKLLLLQVNDGALFLASLDKFMDLSSRFLVLRGQLLLISLHFAKLSLKLEDGLIVVRDAILLSTVHRLRRILRLGRLISGRLHTVTHGLLYFSLFDLL